MCCCAFRGYSCLEKTMSTIINTKLADHKGYKRLWMEGAKLAREGYRPGMRYDLEIKDT